MSAEAGRAAYAYIETGGAALPGRRDRRHRHRARQQGGARRRGRPALRAHRDPGAALRHQGLRDAPDGQGAPGHPRDHARGPPPRARPGDARARGPRHPPRPADHDRPRRGRGRASRCAGSTRTRARTGSSATRRRRRSSRPSRTRAREGLDVHGPLPADTLFSRARGGEFDIVVAMYHDQGHVPVKTLGFNYDETSGHVDRALRRQRHGRPARSCACRWTTAPRSIAPGRASPIPRACSRPSTWRSACWPRNPVTPDEDPHGRARATSD